MSYAGREQITQNNLMPNHLPSLEYIENAHESRMVNIKSKKIVRLDNDQSIGVGDYSKNSKTDKVEDCLYFIMRFLLSAVMSLSVLFFTALRM